MTAGKIMKMKVLLLIFLLFSINLFAHNNGDVRVESIYLARDNGKGAAGEATQDFFTNDIPIYCVVKLDSLKPATVKMVFVAVKVNGVKPDTKVITSTYTTNGEQNEVYFTGKPYKVWTAGNYRIDILIDEKPAQSLDFEIKKTTQQLEAEKQPPPKVKNTAKKFRKS